MTELVDRDLTWARKITERLRLQATNYAEAREKVIATLTEARDGGAADLLGYASWTAYMADVFGDAPLRLERDARQELVAELSAEGMSLRSIEKVVDASRPTIIKDIREHQVVNPLPPEPDPAPREVVEIVTADTRTGEVIDEPEPGPRTITGMDGKQYTRPAPVEPRPKATPITDRFTSAVTDLNRVLDRFHKITEDPAYRRNAETVSSVHRADITRAIGELQTLADTL